MDSTNQPAPFRQRTTFLSEKGLDPVLCSIVERVKSAGDKEMKFCENLVNSLNLASTIFKKRSGESYGI